MIETPKVLAREYEYSRLDKYTPFKIQDIVSDSLIQSDDGISYFLQGKIVNETGKTLSSAKILGTFSVLFKNDITPETNGFCYDIMETIVSESEQWSNFPPIYFTSQTLNINNNYIDYEPLYVVFTLEMNALDPNGYKYNKVIFEVDLTDRWNKMRKKK